VCETNPSCQLGWGRAVHCRIVIGLLAATLVVINVGCSDASSSPTEYRLAVVTRGPIVSTVSATGTLKAVVTVDVGTQISGLIQSLGADFNSEVTKGDVIARIDPRPFTALLNQAEAELAVATANVAIQEASLDESTAELAGVRAGFTEANDELARKRSLLKSNAIPRSVVDTALAIREQARSRVAAGQARLLKQQAQIDLARAQVLQAMAVVKQRGLDLGYTEILSPIDGVVISRNVDAGQTVAASLQAPVLFRIAGDLNRMEVNISVDEADIGKIRTGQLAYFTVDSYLNRTFEGRVEQIRMDGRQISNVVTYTVVATADNPEGSLLPGMTANVSIVVANKQDVLRVPSAAVRLRMPGSTGGDRGGDWVWALDSGADPVRRLVSVGATNGFESEILTGELASGDSVITGLTVARQAH
jgi:HlyD family secretion protein